MNKNSCQHWDCCNGGEAAMTDDEVNKRLCELFELPFDEREGRYGHNQVNPKFQSPEGRIDLLRRMLGRDDWKSFLDCLIGYKEPFWYTEPITIKLFLTEVICNDTGSLARAAVEFLGKEEGKEQS